MCATSITCGNPEFFTLQIDEILEARAKKARAATGHASSIPIERMAASARKRATARESAAPVKAVA